MHAFRSIFWALFDDENSMNGNNGADELDLDDSEFDQPLALVRSNLQAAQQTADPRPPPQSFSLPRGQQFTAPQPTFPPSQVRIDGTWNLLSKIQHLFPLKPFNRHLKIVSQAQLADQLPNPTTAKATTATTLLQPTSTLQNGKQHLKPWIYPTLMVRLSWLFNHCFPLQSLTSSYRKLPFLKRKYCFCRQNVKKLWHTRSPSRSSHFHSTRTQWRIICQICRPNWHHWRHSCQQCFISSSIADQGSCSIIRENNSIENTCTACIASFMCGARDY